MVSCRRCWRRRKWRTWRRWQRRSRRWRRRRRWRLLSSPRATEAARAPPRRSQCPIPHHRSCLWWPPQSFASKRGIYLSDSTARVSFSVVFLNMQVLSAVKEHTSVFANSKFHRPFRRSVSLSSECAVAFQTHHTPHAHAFNLLNSLNSLALTRAITRRRRRRRRCRRLPWPLSSSAPSTPRSTPSTPPSLSFSFFSAPLRSPPPRRW